MENKSEQIAENARKYFKKLSEVYPMESFTITGINGEELNFFVEI